MNKLTNIDFPQTEDAQITPIKPIGVVRLKRLRDLLESFQAEPGHEFDINIWFGEIIVPSDEGGCGFAGCAIGWATQDPWFQEQGLTLKGEKPRVRGGFANSMIDTYGDLAKFFEVSRFHVDFFFNPESYLGENVSAQTVADRITEYLGNK